MANPWAGEVALILNRERWAAKLTLGSLAELEERMEAGGLVDLVSRLRVVISRPAM